MDSSSDAKARDHQGLSHCHRQPWPSMLGVPPSTMADYNQLPYPAVLSLPQYQRKAEAEEGKNANDNRLPHPPKFPYPSEFRTEEEKNAMSSRLPPSENKQDQWKRPRIGSDDDVKIDPKHQHQLQISDKEKDKYPVRGFDNPMLGIYAYNPLLHDSASMLPLPQDKRVEGVPIRRGGYPNDYDIFLIDPNDSRKVYVKVDPDEWEKYQKQRKISEGFDVDYYKWMGAWLVRPVLDLDDNYDYYHQYVQMALDQYNHQHNKGGKLELVKILRLNQEYVCDSIKYMTFIAKDAATGMEKTYQAKYSLRMDKLLIFREEGGKDLVREE